MSEDSHDLPNNEENLPDGFSLLHINAEELNYLISYWELRDHAVLVGWSLRLLHDLSKADEKGWCMCLQKAVIDDEHMTTIPDPLYKAATFRLDWLMPDNEGGFMRIPVDRLEEKMRRDGGAPGSNV